MTWRTDHPLVSQIPVLVVALCVGACWADFPDSRMNQDGSSVYDGGPDSDLNPGAEWGPGPDQGGGDGVLSATKLRQHLGSVRQPCPGGSSAPLVDQNNAVRFVQGSVTLAGAGQPTKLWAGPGPWVTVVFDPNACTGDNWSSAGLVLRGVAWIGQDQVSVPASTTVQDMNLLNTTQSGQFEEERYGADDSGVPASWAAGLQLLKQAVLDAARAP